MYERTYGDKYAALGEYPSAATIAKAIRSDLKAAQKAGDLPDSVGFQVVSDNFAGGCSVDVFITDVPHHGRCPECHGERNSRSYHVQAGGDLCQTCAMWDHGWLTPEWADVLRKVEAIHGAYNHDGSETQVDYFDVRYYGQVSFGARYGTKAWEREQAAKAVA